jgi:hypothetical protein
VRVLGPVVDHEEHARGGQALHEAVEEGLRLAVHPVEILEDDEERLHLALAQEQALEGVEGAATALARIRLLPVRVVHRHVEEERKTGMVLRRLSSRVRSLPVTFSRIRRASSWSSMPK